VEETFEATRVVSRVERLYEHLLARSEARRG
jgi:hypothetical protein